MAQLPQAFRPIAIHSPGYERLKAKMKEAGAIYTGLMDRRKAHGFAEAEAFLAMKLTCRLFAAAWLFACMAALNLDGVKSGLGR